MSASRWRSILVSAAAVLAIVPAGARAQSTADPTTTPGPSAARPRLARSLSGREALASPGVSLAAVAHENNMSESGLRSLLAADADVRIGTTGRLFFVDDALAASARSAAQAAPAAAPPEAQGPFPYSDTFLLHSRPGSSRVIYLDFDGYVVTNSVFNDDPSFTIGASWNATAYDTDGNPGSFSNAEQDAVQSVWQRVSEDYAPFDVDVTTQDPGQAAITRTDQNDNNYGTRAVITSANSSGICSCGGVAFIDVFNLEPSGGELHDYYQPALIFKSNLASTKSVGEAASHEVGHNFGLLHDGNASSGYYAGQGLWAPIMGVGYGKPLTQWSKGEYSGANQLQDDLAIIQSGGAPLRPDDHGNTRASGTALGSGPALNVTGVISTAADVDVFSFTAGNGPLTVNVTPAPTSPNLDAKLTLYNSAGVVVTSADPVATQISTDVAAGLSASISTTVTRGTYYVEVDGVGNGSPTATGYSDYASLGQYTLDATVPPGPSVTFASQTPTAVSVTFANGVGDPADQVVVAPIGSPDTTRTSWAYLNGTQTPPVSGLTSGAVSLPLAGVGVYEVRWFSAAVRTATSTSFTFGDGGILSVSPARLLDSRPGGSTVDGLLAGIGKLTANQVIEVPVVGRGGIPTDATTAVLNITATEPAGAGYVTAYPCGTTRPNSSNLNFVANQTIPNLIATKIGTNGKVCLYTSAATHLLADVNGFAARTSTYNPTDPTRLVDSRSAGTFDGAQAGFGRLVANQVVEVQVGGRAGVPSDAIAATLNLTVADPTAVGYLTAYPCGQARPNASNVNFSSGAAVAGLTISKIGIGGRVCVFTSAPTQLIVDLNGWSPSGATVVPLVPSRLLDTRPAGSTADGQSARGGKLALSQVVELQVGGRAGVPANASTAVLTVTVAETAAVGYITVFPCGTAQPNASTVNFAVGVTVANLAVSRLGTGGKVCLFASAATHLLVDITGYYPALS